MIRFCSRYIKTRQVYFASRLDSVAQAYQRDYSKRVESDDIPKTGGQYFRLPCCKMYINWMGRTYI